MLAAAVRSKAWIKGRWGCRSSWTLLISVENCLLFCFCFGWPKVRTLLLCLHQCTDTRFSHFIFFQSEYSVLVQLLNWPCPNKFVCFHRGTELSFSALHQKNVHKRDSQFKKLLSAVFSLRSAFSFRSSLGWADCSQFIFSPRDGNSREAAEGPQPGKDQSAQTSWTPAGVCHLLEVSQCYWRQHYSHPCPLGCPIIQSWERHLS